MGERTQFLAQSTIADDNQVNPVTMTHYPKSSQQNVNSFSLDKTSHRTDDGCIFG
jgi:hypothetical protein